MNYETLLTPKEILDAIDDGALVWLIAADFRNWILLDVARVRSAVETGTFPGEMFLDDEGHLIVSPRLVAP